MRRKLKWFLGAVVVGAGTYAGTLRATPASGFVGTTLAVARFDDIDISNSSGHPELDSAFVPVLYWRSRMKTQGPSDVYVQSNVWAPGGSTGWHTHPGASLILVTMGAVTAYDADDPTCTPRVYTEGMGFLDPGGTHVHLLRNESSIEAHTIAVQMIPAAAVRRIDAPASQYCAF